MLNGYQAEIGTQILFLMMLGVSLNLLMGYAGQLTMAHAFFYGVGAYTSGILAIPVAEQVAASVTTAGRSSGGYSWPVYFAVIGAAVVAFALAGIVAFPAISRVRGDFLILLTIAVQLGGSQLMGSWTSFTGGLFGLYNVPPLSFFGKSLTEPADAFWLLLPITAVVVVLAFRLGESPFGRLLKGIRENESAVQAAGKNTVRPKLLVFAISAGVAGLAGAFSAHYYQFIAPTTYSVDLSIQVVSIVILGGIGNLIGTLIGALVVGLLPALLKAVLGQPGLVWQSVIFGIVLIAIVMFRPEGILPEGRGRIFDRRRQPLGASPAADANLLGGTAVLPAHPEADESGPQQDVVLSVEGLTKSFGGLNAVQDASFQLRKGRITALIGPNGAGKTTIFNMMTGFLRPDAGRVLLHGVDVTGKPPHELPALGMARSFQDGRMFQKLNAVQNVAMAIPAQTGEGVSNLYLRARKSTRSEKETLGRATQLLEFVGFKGSLKEPVGTLAYGDQKLVGIARLLATGSEVLLLDEPTSGVDPESVNGVVDVIEQLRDHGVTICLVEHSVHFVERLADDAVFLDQGRVLASGTVRELMDQTELTQVYFGV